MSKLKRRALGEKVKRPGPGRPAGSGTGHQISDAVRKRLFNGSLPSPMDVLIGNMRFYWEAALAGIPAPMIEQEGVNSDPLFWRKLAEDSAVRAAPYVHARLAAIEAKVDGEVQHSYVSAEPPSKQEWLELYGRKTIDVATTPED